MIVIYTRGEERSTGENGWVRDEVIDFCNFSNPITPWPRGGDAGCLHHQSAPPALVVLNKLHQLFTRPQLSAPLWFWRVRKLQQGVPPDLSSLPASRYIWDVYSQPLIRVKIIFLPSKTKNWCATLNTAGSPQRLKKNNFEKICHVLYPVLSILRPNGKLNFKNLKTENFPPNRPRRIDE